MNSRRGKSLRFDYRLHLKLDRHHDLAENAKLTQLGNQAGIFADSDSASGTTIDAITVTVFSLSTSKGLSYGSFVGAEKPLVFEGTGPGLAYGFPS